MPSFTAPSNTVLSGGSFVRPSWRRNQTAQTWIAIPASNTMDDVDPEKDPTINPNHPGNAPWHGGQGLQSAVGAWCGMAFDPVKCTLWGVLNGGHADYGGNETYKFRMDVDTPIWVRLNKPSGAIGNTVNLNDGQEATGLFADGRLRNTHTYNKPFYAPGVGPGLCVQGSVWMSGQDGTDNNVVMSEVTGEMVHFGPAENSAGSGVYDPSRHCLWSLSAGTTRLSKFDLTTRTWTTVGSLFARTGGCALEYVPGHDFLFYVGSSPPNGFEIINVSTGARTRPAISGAFSGMALNDGSKPAYVPAEDALYFWDNSSNTQRLHKMTVPADPFNDTWTVEQINFGGVTPTAAKANGTFGRFGYSERLDGFYLLNSHDESVYFGARA